MNIHTILLVIVLPIAIIISYLAHQVNCQGVMGSNKATLSTNVANQVRHKWPKVYDEYIKLCDRKDKSSLLGMVQPIYPLWPESNKEILNMFGQEFYGNNGEQYTSYEAFETCIEKVRDYAKRDNLTVAMPFNIGCARGGASWSKIYELLNKYFGSEGQPNLTLYKYK